MSDPTTLGIAALGSAYGNGHLDPRDVTEAYLERTAALDPKLRAYILVAADRARCNAEASARRWRDGRPLGPLDGVPIALKDNIDVARLACTAGTAAFAKRVPEKDAACFSRLAAAGAALLGKLNMHEGALGATTDNPVYGRCINPRKDGYTPGGSSGGSGAAVAGRLTQVALGTDTLGSVRIPAAYCGVYGLKPTTGAVSNDGVIPLSTTLDCVGPLARSPDDLAVIARALLGLSGRHGDPAPLRGRVIGRPVQLDHVELTPEVTAAYEAFLVALSRAGARIVEIGIADWQPGGARRAGLIVSEAEAVGYWEKALGPSLDGLSPAFTAMLRYPAKAGSARVAAAYETIRWARRGCRRALEETELIALPTAPQTSFPHSDEPPENQADMTALASLAGAPAVSLPFGDGPSPIGMQLVAAPGRDDLLLALTMTIGGIKTIS